MTCVKRQQFLKCPYSRSLLKPCLNICPTDDGFVFYVILKREMYLFLCFLLKVFQRRRDGLQSFEKTWDEYAQGFGNLSNEFWLGNNNLRILTKPKKSLGSLGGNVVLRAEVTDWADLKAFSKYNTFTVTGDLYTLTAEDFDESSTAGKLFSVCRPFSKPRVRLYIRLRMAWRVESKAEAVVSKRARSLVADDLSADAARTQGANRKQELKCRP